MLSGVLFVLSVVDSVVLFVAVSVSVAVAVSVVVVAVGGGLNVIAVVVVGGGVSFCVSVAELLCFLLGGFFEFIDDAFAGISF